MVIYLLFGTVIGCAAAITTGWPQREYFSSWRDWLGAALMLLLVWAMAAAFWPAVVGCWLGRWAMLRTSEKIR